MHRRWVLRKARVGVMILTVTSVLFVCLHHLVLPYAGLNVEKSYVKLFPGFRRTHPGVKTILIWKPFLSENILGSMQNQLRSCPAKCSITDHAEEIRHMDAVIFHLYNLWRPPYKIGSTDKIFLPSYRRQDQVWVLFNMEPPHNLWGDVKMFNGVFNWTAWYRRDATIWWAYGGQRPLIEEEAKGAGFKFSGKNFHGSKLKEVSGMISNCRDPAERYKLVYELQEYLEVEMFGKCYDNQCGNPDAGFEQKCYDNLAIYKFYLAFENGRCRDYVTEKYWLALKRDQIPIVNWKNIDPEIPIPGSYINIHGFDNIKLAADYIKKVSGNETLYNNYFAWKLRYKDAAPSAICSICERLHENNVPLQTFEDLEGWINKDDCSKLKVQLK